MKLLRIFTTLTLFALPLVALAQSLDIGIQYGTLTGLSPKDPRETIASIISVALSLLGIIALIIIVAGGFMWMTSSGNEEKIDKAKKMIIAGVVGLAIILSAYAIAKFVIENLIRSVT